MQLSCLFSRKRYRGQSIVELMAGLIVLIPVVLLCIDFASMVIGSTVNDNICREAARAAASGEPDAPNPKNRAEAVIAANFKKGGIIEEIALDGDPVNNNVVKPEPIEFGGPVQGTVTIRTRAVVRPPFLVGAVSPQVTFNAQSTFPYTFIYPNTTTPN